MTAKAQFIEKVAKKMHDAAYTWPWHLSDSVTRSRCMRMAEAAFKAIYEDMTEQEHMAIEKGE